MIDLFDKTNDYIKSQKIKAFPLVCSKYLSSWTGLGRSGHVQITTFGSISHVRVQNWVFDEISKWFCMAFAGEAEKTRCFDQKP